MKAEDNLIKRITDFRLKLQMEELDECGVEYWVQGYCAAMRSVVMMLQDIEELYDFEKEREE